MPLDTQTELAEFHRFVGERLQAGARLSPEEVFEEWQLVHPDQELHEQNVRAIQAALREMEAGDRGIPADEHIKQLTERIEAMGRR